VMRVGMVSCDRRVTRAANYSVRGDMLPILVWRSGGSLSSVGRVRPGGETTTILPLHGRVPIVLDSIITFSQDSQRKGLYFDREVSWLSPPI